MMRPGPLTLAQDADRRGQEDDGNHRDKEVGQIIEHHRGSPSAADAPHHQGRAVDGRDLDRLAGGEGFVAAGLPAFAIGAHVACPSPPVEDLGRQAVHRLRADARRPARQSARPTKTTRAKTSTAGRPTTVGDRWKPGALNKIAVPSRNAARPPRPSMKIIGSDRRYGQKRHRGRSSLSSSSNIKFRAVADQQVAQAAHPARPALRCPHDLTRQCSASIWPALRYASVSPDAGGKIASHQRWRRAASIAFT